MASKPVRIGTEKAVKKHRKPLAQGRLVNDSGRLQAKTVVKGVKDSNEHKVATPRSKLQSRIVHQAGKSLTPRRETSVNRELISPAVPSRNNLDLSDEESEKGDWSRAELKSSNRSENVLVVDALRQSFDPNRSEVDIVMGYTRSPAKVFCHSPATKVRVESRSRRVLVDEVPSVSILTQDPDVKPLKDKENIDSLKSNPTTKNGSKNIVVDSETERKVVSPGKLPVPQLPPGRLRPKHYPQPNFDDSLKSMSPNHEVDKNVSDDQMSVISTTSSLGEVLGNSHTANPSRGESSKKKKGKIIPSRYMQSASKFKTSSSNQGLNKSTPLQSVYLKTNSSKLKCSTKRVGHLKSSSKNKSLSLNQTPMVQQGKGKGKTSTPTHDDISFMHNIDTSAIAPTNMSTLMTSVLPTGDTSIAQPVKKPSKDKRQMSQLQLDMAYCEYLQWLYLRSSLDKAFHQQENNAMAQITGLWNETEKLYTVEHDLKSELQQLHHANNLDEQLDLQRSGLGPIIPNLKQLSEEHRVMAHALDTTRHQIATRGIHLPADHHNFQENLTSALNESEMLLGQLSMITRQDQPEVVEYSRTIKALKDAVDDGSNVLGQCQELMAATEALTITETSLRIQSIQTPRENE